MLAIAAVAGVVRSHPAMRRISTSSEPLAAPMSRLGPTMISPLNCEPSRLR